MDMKMDIKMIEGRLVRGLGQASDFTRIEWVRRQFMDLAGIDPHPGTVNLELVDEDHRERWVAWRAGRGQVMEPGAEGFCSARCYSVRISGRIPAAIVLPEVDGYPDEKIEMVAALPVREHLSLAEGDSVGIELCGPLAAKAVMFDIDGTIVDSMGAYLEVARLAAAPHGFEVSGEHVRRSLATGSSFWNGVVPLDTPDREAVVKAMSAHAGREWPRVLREHGRTFAGLEQTLDVLKRFGIALGIVSGARPEVLDILREDGILDRFDTVILGADVARRKPDPEGILECLRRLGIAPDAAIYVGDSAVDIQASRAAGVRSVGVLTGAADSATLSAHWPDRLVSSHSGLVAIVEAI